MNEIFGTIEADDLDEQREWSDATFGPGARTAGVLDHLKKELHEVEAKPDDLEEWIDLIVLAVDGATRQGYSGIEVIEAYHKKMAKNRRRTWPDWRTCDPDKAIEHVSSRRRDIEIKALLSGCPRCRAVLGSVE